MHEDTKQRTVPRLICGPHDAGREDEPCLTLLFVL